MHLIYLNIHLIIIVLSFLRSFPYSPFNPPTHIPSSHERTNERTRQTHTRPQVALNVVGIMSDMLLIHLTNTNQMYNRIQGRQRAEHTAHSPMMSTRKQPSTRASAWTSYSTCRSSLSSCECFACRTISVTQPMDVCGCTHTHISSSSSK